MSIGLAIQFGVKVDDRHVTRRVSRRGEGRAGICYNGGLMDISMVSPDEGWIATDGDTMLHYENGSWSETPGAYSEIHSVAIVSAERDELIPTSHSQALARRAKKLVFDQTIGGAGHNDIYARSDFHAAMRQALEAVTG